jgi:hypothetical protein
MANALNEMLAAFPPLIKVPEELVAYFQWLDEQDLYRNFDGDGFRYALIDPSQEQSCVGIQPPDPDYAKAWTQSDDPEVYERLAAFCRTGGDGSYAALWLDDGGQVQIVHLGSGSGSVMMGVMVNNAVDFLRLLAIGYDELCWPQNHHRTPDEVFAEENGDEMEDDPDMEFPAPPAALRDWVKTHFGATIPEVASEIVGAIPSMDDEHSDDPFWQWDHSLPKWQS